MKSFFFNGTERDLIRALPLMRDKGGGILYIQGMSKYEANWLSPLLMAQPYMEGICYAECPHGAVDISRALSTPEKPWLFLEPEEPHGCVVIHRSTELADQHGAWNQGWHKALEAIHLGGLGAPLFVGTPPEWEAFVSQFYNPVGDEPQPEQWRTANALELARVIAGAGMFIGSAGLPAVIAEALKVAPRIFETEAFEFNL